MAHAVGLNGLIAFEVEDRLQEPVAGRVALKDGHQVGARGLNQRGLGLISAINDLAQDHH